ncbi:MAG: autotransporter domain-containing protein [Planctomycetia bacterium]|nr:autotransporter domain-containing protein [Planctomycetia bacterium]
MCLLGTADRGWAEDVTITPTNPTYTSSPSGDHTITIQGGDYSSVTDGIQIDNNGQFGRRSGGNAGTLEILFENPNANLFPAITVNNYGGDGVSFDPGTGGYGGDGGAVTWTLSGNNNTFKDAVTISSYGGDGDGVGGFDGFGCYGSGGNGGAVTWTLSGNNNIFKDAVTISSDGSDGTGSYGYGGSGGDGGAITWTLSGEDNVFEKKVEINASGGQGTSTTGAAGNVELNFVGNSSTEFQGGITANLTGNGATDTGAFSFNVSGSAQVTLNGLAVTGARTSAINLSDNSKVTLANGSATGIENLSLTGISTLNVVLNRENQVAEEGVTTFNAGATKFQVSGTATGDANATLKYMLDTSMAGDGIYLGATGDFSSFNSTIVGQVIGSDPQGQFVVSTKDNTGIWLSLTESERKVIRLDANDNLQRQDDTFDGVFLTGNGDPATGDKIILTADANSTATTTLGNTVTSLSIYSNAADTVRKITNTNATAGSGAFLSAAGDLTLNLSDVQFVGGKGATDSDDDVNGGAIFSAGNLTLTGSAIFGGTGEGEGNTATYGGALGAYGSGTNDIVLNGNFQFLNNTAYAGGAIYAGDDVDISGTFHFENNTAGDEGGAIYAGDDVDISGTFHFENNTASNDGGAIYAFDTVTLSGGTYTFTNNSAGGSGGAICADDDVDLSGTFRFENNTAGDNGGAIYADDDVDLSGTFHFENNTAGDEGGAIYADDEEIMLTGQFDFINNTAKDKGGAIITEDDNVVLYGKGSRMTFIGNKIGNEDDGWENNDIWIDHEDYALIIKDGGTYSFGGGIHSDGSFIIGVDGQDGAPVVTLGSGSITEVGSFSLAEEDSTLNVVLNEKNKVDSWTNTTFNEGATKFQVSGTATGDADAILRYVLGDVADNEIYLGATGDFSGFNSGIVAQTTGTVPTGTFIATKKNSAGIWLGVMNATGAVVRMNTNGAIYESDTFDEVFNPDILPPPATGDSIVLTQNVSAEKMVSLTGVTALSIYSNTADTVRKITMDSDVAEGQGAFLRFDGDVELTLADVQFAGGKGATDDYGDKIGGAFYSQGNMKVNAANVTFEDNSAETGGAIGSDGDINFIGENTQFVKNEATMMGGAIGARGTVTISGSGKLDQNSALWYGGAISGSEVNISGQYEITNNSAGNPDATDAAGGAVFASYGVTFSGSETEIVFRGNTVTDQNGTVANDVDNLFGAVTIRDGGTYYFGGGIVSPTLNIGENGQDGTPNVTFGANSISQVSNAWGDSELNLQDATLTFELGANAASRDEDNPYIDATGTTSVNIQNVTTDVTMNDDYVPTNGQEVLLMKANSGDLSNLEDNVIKDNNLWLWETRLAESDSQYWFSATMKDPASRFGNGYAAKDLYGWDFYDNNLSDAELRANINGATGEIFASAAHVQTQRMTYLNQMITNRTRNLQTCGSCPCDASRPNLWFSSYGLGGSTSMHDNFMGYDYTSWGMMIGAEFVRDDLMKFGVFYGYGQTETESVQSALNSDDHTFGAYLQWQNALLGGYSLALGSFSFSDNEGSRWYSDNAFQNNYDSWMGLLHYEKGWETSSGMFGVLNPYISLQYMRYDADDFADATLAVNDNTYDSLRSALGFRVTKNLHALCLTGGLAWRHEWLDENASFTATTANGSATIFGNGTGRDWVELNLGVQYSFACLTLSGDYYLFANGDNTLHAGMGTLTWKF